MVKIEIDEVADELYTLVGFREIDHSVLLNKSELEELRNTINKVLLEAEDIHWTERLGKIDTTKRSIVWRSWDDL